MEVVKAGRQSCGSIRCLAAVPAILPNIAAAATAAAPPPPHVLQFWLVESPGYLRNGLQLWR